MTMDSFAALSPRDTETFVGVFSIVGTSSLLVPRDKQAACPYDGIGVLAALRA